MADREATGVVDFFNETGGWGFIDSPSADEDVFFHMEDVGGPDLVEGTNVILDIEQAKKGPRAKNIQRKSEDRSPSDKNRDTTETGSSNAGGENGDEQSGTEIFKQNNTASDDKEPSYCPACGSYLAGFDVAKFCPDCGTEI